MKYILVLCCFLISSSIVSAQMFNILSYTPRDSLMFKINGNYEYCKVESFDFDEEGEYDIGDGDITHEYFYYNSGKMKESYYYSTLVNFVKNYDESGNNINLIIRRDEEVIKGINWYYDSLDNCIAYSTFFSNTWASSETDSIYLNIKYDTSGKVIEKNIIMNAEEGRENKSSNTLHRAYLTYNKLGLLIKEEVFDDNRQLRSKKLIEYNEEGLELKITSDDNIELKYYDDNGNLTKYIFKDNRGKIHYRIMYKYDNKNQIRECKIFSNATQFHFREYLEKYFYNEEGNLSKIIIYVNSLEEPFQIEFLTYYKEYIPED